MEIEAGILFSNRVKRACSFSEITPGYPMHPFAGITTLRLPVMHPCKRSWCSCLLIGGVLLLLSFPSLAQRDSTKSQTIDIISSYKPVLRPAAKINFTASPLPADTFGRKLAYNIPAQNLFFVHQPTTLKPLALQQDTGLKPGLRNFVKAGFGSLSTPYLSTALSAGNGITELLNLYGSYTSSKGKIQYQDFTELKIKGTGSYFNNGKEAYGSAGINEYKYFLYGYDHTALAFTKKDLKRKYQDIHFEVGYKNTVLNKSGINYDPNIEVHLFSGRDDINETGLMLDVPAEKKFGDNVLFKLKGSIGLNRLKNKTGAADIKVSNHLVQLAPELVYYSDRFTFHAGITPAWDNDEVSALPNIYGEVQLQQNVLMLQAGWVGKYTQNTFRTLSLQNPYMQDPVFLLNTREIEFYGGVKATLGKHFTFNSKAAVITYNNLPLFVNDTLDGKSFYISNESKMNNFQLHGDMNYVHQDKFTVSAALDINNYTGLKNNAKAWHLLPILVTGTLRWNAFKQVLFKGDIFAFSKVPAVTKNDMEKKLKGGVDMSAGAEFKITPKYSAWLDFNNILNNRYQRWNNYPVYGLQVIGGILIQF